MFSLVFSITTRSIKHSYCTVHESVCHTATGFSRYFGIACGNETSLWVAIAHCRQARQTLDRILRSGMSENEIRWIRAASCRITLLFPSRIRIINPDTKTEEYALQADRILSSPKIIGAADETSNWRWINLFGINWSKSQSNAYFNVSQYNVSQYKESIARF